MTAEGPDHRPERAFLAFGPALRAQVSVGLGTADDFAVLAGITITITNTGSTTITCGGEFDSAERSYRDNIVVFAALVGSHRVSASS